MKKLSPSLVAVKRITSKVPAANFADRDLDKLARLILDAGGLIHPIIVRRVGMDAYEIVDGDFEYYAAARAREINAFKGETIGAFILEPENEELLLEQVAILRKSGIIENLAANETPKESLITEDSSKESESLEAPSSFEQRLANIEARLANQINELQAEHAREKQVLAERIQEIENLFSQQLPLLIEAQLANRINQLKSEWESTKPAVVEPEPVPQVMSQSISLLDALNNQDSGQLTANLKAAAGLKPSVIQLILRERDVRLFVSFANVVERITGLTDKTMIKIIDYWQNTHKL